jgi:hypothetical protein
MPGRAAGRDDDGPIAVRITHGEHVLAPAIRPNIDQPEVTALTVCPIRMNLGRLGGRPTTLKNDKRR